MKIGPRPECAGAYKALDCKVALGAWCLISSRLSFVAGCGYRRTVGLPINKRWLTVHLLSKKRCCLTFDSVARARGAYVTSYTVMVEPKLKAT